MAVSGSRSVQDELKARIDDECDFFRGRIPERHAIAWRAYLAGLLEWNVIDLAGYDALLALLPPVVDDPAIVILRGRD